MHFEKTNIYVHDFFINSYSLVLGVRFIKASYDCLLESYCELSANCNTVLEQIFTTLTIMCNQFLSPIANHR